MRGRSMYHGETMKRSSVFVVVVLCLVVGFIAGVFVEPPAATRTAPELRQVITERQFTVTRVVDGDTFWIEGYDGVETKCRFVFIDTPERDEPGFDAATEKLRELIEGREVEIRFSDPKGRKRDNFGRLLVSVDVDGVDVEQAMLASGLARPYK